MEAREREREEERGERDELISDAVDYKGDPAKRSSTGGWLSAASILGKLN